MKRFAVRNGKRYFVALPSRIQQLEQLGAKNPHLAKLVRAMHAVRWIGNAGSHADERSLKRDDLFDGFGLRLDDDDLVNDAAQ
jgi:hypothetical protein